MPEFPTLSTQPTYPLEETFVQNVIKSDFEGGYTQIRARHTRIRRIFTVTYKNVPTADKNTLFNFYASTLKGGAMYFTWTHPVTGVSYNVYFQDPPTFNLVFLDRWDIFFKLVEF